MDRKRCSGNEDKNFIYPDHKIQITPSTFIYKSPIYNLFWSHDEDKVLLDNIAVVKRESRMENENSEDALT